MLVRWARSEVRKALRRVVSEEVQQAVDGILPLLPQIIEYQNSPPDQRQYTHDHTISPRAHIPLYHALKEQLRKNGVTVDDVEVDVMEFERWLQGFARLRDHYSALGDVCIEKCLEHYLVWKHLAIKKGEVYVDVAAAGSPWATHLRRSGVEAYRLDLSYPRGIHGHDIGADAGITGLPNGFASALSSQCAFECFDGDADVRFVKEADRILRRDGRYAVVPLYLEDEYFVLASPLCRLDGITFDEDAKRVWRDDGQRVPFARFYSPASFRSRIYQSLPESMSGRVLHFTNLDTIMARYPGQRIYSFFMFYCEKT